MATEAEAMSANVVVQPEGDTTLSRLKEESNSSALDSLEPNKRCLIDEDVLAWVTAGQTEGKVITPNLIRQKAYEIGRQYDPYFKASINWYNKWKKKYNYEESPEADALKHKKRSYTAAFKLYAVQRANELLSVSQASLELNVSRRCLQRWKEEIDVISKVAEQASNAVYRRPGQGRKVTDVGLDAQLLEWLEQAWRNGEQVTATIIRQKAREMSSNQDFKASLGWFVKWQKRHNIDLKERTMESPLMKEKQGTDPKSLRLRLLPEGQEIVYSDRANLSRKRKRDFEGAVLQGDEEFDRLLLTWLVERWEAGLVVNEKMLRDRAVELNTNQDFRPSKNWVTDWKDRYNVSLEDQTYGVAGESEGEIVEESQVYDEVNIHDHNPPLTPTKEEAATALASLASEDPGVTSGGMEIAQALQKLASAFGLTHDVSKGSLAEQLHLTVPQVLTPTVCSSSLSSVLSPTVSSSATTTYLLENGEVQVGAEEVISEEVVTDEPVVVLETTGEHVEPMITDNLGRSEVTTPSSSFLLLASSPSKVTSVAVGNSSSATSSFVNLDPGIPHFSEVNLLTTLAKSHFTTETCNSNSGVVVESATTVVDQLIETAAVPTTCSIAQQPACTSSEDIISQILAPPNSVINEGGELQVLHTNNSSIEPSGVAIASEVVISEPVPVGVVSSSIAEEGSELDEPIVLLFKGDDDEKLERSVDDIKHDELMFEDVGTEGD